MGTFVRNIDITTKERVTVEEFWMMRGIVYDHKKGRKDCVCEEIKLNCPSPGDIADFLVRHRGEIDFVSVVQNYREVKELPF